MHPYDVVDSVLADTLMGRPRQDTSETFGRRMASLRTTAGYTQRSLAAELGISQRMVAYYESQSERPPAQLLPALAEAFGISIDQLLGHEPISPRKRPVNSQLMRKLKQVEKLPPRARTAVLEHIDALLSKHGGSGSR